MAASEDNWDGNEYLSRPGARETGRINAGTVMKAVAAAGYTPDEISSLRAIEVGAGVGTVTPHLRFGSVYAAEPSQSMADVLAYMIRDVPAASYGVHEVSPAWAAALPEGERYDVALCTLVAHHVSDLPEFFAGVRAALKPGGLFVVLEFRHGDDGTDLSVKSHLMLKPDMKAVDDDATPISGDQFRASWTPAEMAAKFTQAGFVDTGSINGDPVPAFGDPTGVVNVPPVPTMAVWGRRPQ